MDNLNKNAQIELALADLKSQEKPNVNGTAMKHRVVESTLRRRWKGETVSMATASIQFKQRLSGPQEQALVDLINKLTDRGLPPTSSIVRNLAEEMIKSPVGKNWTGDFARHHKNVLKSVYLRNIDYQRHKAENVSLFKQIYDLLHNAIEKYNITAENLYNWDKKGFIMGTASSSKRIMTLEALKSGRITFASQDGSREFISLLACIGATGIALPPALIYKADSTNLQDTW